MPGILLFNLKLETWNLKPETKRLGFHEIYS